MFPSHDARWRYPPQILLAAFSEFYRNGFQGGSLNDIVAGAGATKGALFHHFDSKQALGYAVIDEVIGLLLLKRWLAPVANSKNPSPTSSAPFANT